MTALDRLAQAVEVVGVVPYLGEGVEGTPAALVHHVMSSPLTPAQVHYLTKLNFVLALEQLAEIERTRQLVVEAMKPALPAVPMGTFAPGRTVLFHTSYCGDLPGVIVRVMETTPGKERADVCVFNPATAQFATVTMGGIHYSRTPKIGTFRFPSDDQVSRVETDEKGEAPESVLDGASSPIPQTETAAS